MIIIENIKEQISNTEKTLEMIKECLWHSKLTKRTFKVKRGTTKARLF